VQTDGTLQVSKSCALEKPATEEKRVCPFGRDADGKYCVDISGVPNHKFKPYILRSLTLAYGDLSVAVDRIIS
jgi:hypothetical protein